MRRMLDPKEVGGGNEKLYCHCISFENDSNNKGGYIILNYYSKKKDKFTYETFRKEFDEDKHLACNGFVHDGNNYFTALYLQLAKKGVSEEIHVRYLDTARNIYDLTYIYWYTFRDNVSEVI